MSEPASPVGRFLARHRELNLAFIDQGLVSGANFLVGVLVARFLGLDDYGVYTLVWMGVLFLNGQHHAFIVAPMMSFAPKIPPADRPAYYGGVLVQHLLVSVGALLAFGVALVVTDHFLPGWEGDAYAPAVCAAAFAYQSQDALRRHFFVRGTPLDALVIDLVGYGSQVGLLFFLFTHAEPQTVTAFWAVAGGMGIGALVGIFRLEVTIPDRPAVFDGLVRHWRFAKWLIGSEIMRWTSENFFVIISGAALGPFAAGVMNAAKTIMGVTHVLFLGLGNIAPAGAAKAWHDGGARALRGYLASVTAYGGALTLLFAGVAALFPSYLMGLVFGAEYAEYGFALQWFAAIYLMTFLHIPLSAGLRAVEHTGPLFWARGMATVFTVIVALPLIDQYGLTGALAGSFLVNVAQQATLFVAFRRALRTTFTGGGEGFECLSRGETADVFLEPGGIVRKVYLSDAGGERGALAVARNEYRSLQLLEGTEGVSTPKAVELIEGERPAIRMEACPGENLRVILRKLGGDPQELQRIADRLAVGMLAINRRLGVSSIDYSLNNTIYDRTEGRIWFVDFADIHDRPHLAEGKGIENSLGNFLENGLFEMVRLRNLFAFEYRRLLLDLMVRLIESILRTPGGEGLRYEKAAQEALMRYRSMINNTNTLKRWWYQRIGQRAYLKNLAEIGKRTGLRSEACNGGNG